MNKDEKIAETYLKPKSINLVFEPDGNIPPDFVIDKKIAIEVRRLNQQYKNEKTNELEGLEKQEFPLIKTINNELSSYLKEDDCSNFWVAVDFKRDVGKAKSIKKNIHNAVLAFNQQSQKIPFIYNLSSGVKLSFIAKAENLSKKYKVGIESDDDSGGFVVGEYILSISHCLFEKEEKIKPYYNQYKTWWLLLVDHMGYADSTDFEDIKLHLPKSSSFERIIVIDLDSKEKFSYVYN